MKEIQNAILHMPLFRSQFINAVSKKIGAKPQRNRLKRRFRAAIDLHSNLLDQRLDYVIVVNAEAVQTRFESIDDEVRTLITKVIQRWAAELESF